MEVYLSLCDDCRYKTAGNPGSQISIHAIKYTYNLIYAYIYIYI